MEEGRYTRRAVARSVAREVARALRPAYSSTRRLAEKAKVGAALGSKIWPPSPEAFDNHYDELLSILWVELESESRAGRMGFAGASAELVPVLGMAATVALQEDMRSFATSMEECAHVLQVGLLAIEGVEENGTLVFSDMPDKQGTYVATRSTIPAVGGGNGTAAELLFFDAEARRPRPGAIREFKGRGCDAMAPLWKAEAQLQGPFENFSWHGPDSGLHKAVMGFAPFYSPDGHKPVGFFGASVSVVWSINPVLAKLIEDGGDFEDGAQLAIVSQSGVLLGTSEFDIHSAKALDNLCDLPPGSVLSEAITLIKESARSSCPPSRVSILEGRRLVEVTPFYTEDYGLPPMHERWCVIETFPRDHVYYAIDTAWRQKIVSTSINFMLFFFAITLFLVAFFLALRSNRGLRIEKIRADSRQVLAAVKDVHSLNSPMVLVSAATFLQLATLEDYESLRDQGLVTVLDSLDDVMGFRQKSMILFFSHQWLSRDFPDVEDGIQLAAMKGAVRTVQSEPLRKKEVYIWCDFISIAQRHPRMQQAAINSLPVYASVADKFIIIAPPAVHVDLECECTLETYNQRGWCRAEMLAKACGSGIHEMYACTDTKGTLSVVTADDLSRLSLNIFEGHFTVPEDVESLVQPALGLYALALRNRDLPHMRLIHSHIQQDKERFFPRSYRSVKRRGQVELFGERVRMLESYIASGEDATWEHRII